MRSLNHVRVVVAGVVEPVPVPSMAGRHGCTSDDVAALMTRASSVKKKRRPEDTPAVLNPLVLAVGGPASQFITLLQTDSQWETEHNIYIQHLGCEHNKGQELRAVKASVLLALCQHEVVSATKRHPTS